jgi:spore germination cell wall hydrolase CwlJ-like protein
MDKLLKLALLFIALNATPAHAADKQETQIACMAKNIYYEAGGEPFEGKLAVGQVVINRMNHPSYPGTVCGVVFQRTEVTCQFSWVCENKSPINRNSRNWQESLDAAHYLLTHGLRCDKLNDSVLFFKTRTSPFVWKKYYIKVVTIGNHDFYMRKPRG